MLLLLLLLLSPRLFSCPIVRASGEEEGHKEKEGIPPPSSLRVLEASFASKEAHIFLTRLKLPWGLEATILARWTAVKEKNSYTTNQKGKSFNGNMDVHSRQEMVSCGLGMYFLNEGKGTEVFPYRE